MSVRRTVLAREGYSQWFVIVFAVFVTCLITANISAVKLVYLFGFILPAGVIIFPMSYMAGDVLTEVYGFRRARQEIWLVNHLKRTEGVDVYERDVSLNPLPISR